MPLPAPRCHRPSQLHTPSAHAFTTPTQELALSADDASVLHAIACAPLPSLEALDITGPCVGAALAAGRLPRAVGWARGLQRLRLVECDLTGTSFLKDGAFESLEVGAPPEALACCAPPLTRRLQPSPADHACRCALRCALSTSANPARPAAPQEIDLSLNPRLGTTAGLAGLAAAPLPRLETLNLDYVDLQPAAAAVLDAAPWVRRLRVLELRQWRGGCGAEEARLLAALHFALEDSPALLALDRAGRLRHTYTTLDDAEARRRRAGDSVFRSQLKMSLAAGYRPRRF